MEKSSLNGKNILFVSYFFPPVGSPAIPGAMRTIKFIRHLTDGEIHVLTTQPHIESERSALKHIHLPINNEQIHRVGTFDIFNFFLSSRAAAKRALARRKKKIPEISPTNTQTIDNGDQEPSIAKKLKDFIYHLCYFPDQAGPWIWPAFILGKRVAVQKNIDVIFATGSPWSGLLVGYLISKATKKPLIVDFRDPWMDNPFVPSKGALIDRWSEQLEGAIVHHAAAISLNTEPLMGDFLRRYPEIQPDRFFVMPNGFDLTDLPEVSPSISDDSTFITLCHTGQLYGVRDPAVLLNAIQAANKVIGRSGPTLGFRQIGEVTLSYDIKVRYADMIKNGSLVLDPPMPYQACIQELMQSHWVVNVQPATRTQVPSKLYDYLAINKPILNITPRDGALGIIVSKHQVGLLFDFNETDSLTNALIKIAHSTASKFSGYAARPQFDCRIITETLAKRIEKITLPSVSTSAMEQ